MKIAAPIRPPNLRRRQAGRINRHVKFWWPSRKARPDQTMTALRINRFITKGMRHLRGKHMLPK